LNKILTLPLEKKIDILLMLELQSPIVEACEVLHLECKQSGEQYKIWSDNGEANFTQPDGRVTKALLDFIVNEL
jgi:hypothetical protein